MHCPTRTERKRSKEVVGGKMPATMERVPKIALLLTLVLAAALIETEVVAQVVCNMPVADLVDCKQSVTGSNPPDPTPKCCGALSHGDLTCLCRNYKGLMRAYGIDLKRAMELPAKCGFTPPPKC